MKNRDCLPVWSAFFFLMTWVLAFFSWMGSIYAADEVQSLLSTEGIRWMLGRVVENYVRTPALGVALILSMGLGIGVRAGLYDTLRLIFKKERALSRKERRAFIMALVSLGMYLLMVVVALLLPWNFLLGVTGSLFRSPFSAGLVYIFSVGLGLSGVIYGYAIDAFRRSGDVFEGMSLLIRRCASYFVLLFWVVQFFSALTYTRLDVWMSFSENVVSVLFGICCYVPLLLQLKKHIYNNKV